MKINLENLVLESSCPPEEEEERKDTVNTKLDKDIYMLGNSILFFFRCNEILIFKADQFNVCKGPYMLVCD